MNVSVENLAWLEGKYPDFEELYHFINNGGHDIKSDLIKDLLKTSIDDWLMIHSHEFSNTNPLKKTCQKPTLHTLVETDKHLAKLFDVLNDDVKRSLQEYFENKKVYFINTVGFETGHVNNEERDFLMSKWMELSTSKFSKDETFRLLGDILKADIFEQYLHKRFVGQKRFSLEGLEVLIPFLNTLLLEFTNHDYTNGVLAMAHRGRLNVLTHVLGKSYSSILADFDAPSDSKILGNTGDVKYHKGFINTITFGEKTMNLRLCSNPSHLESVASVAMGLSKAIKDQRRVKVATVILHGDAAVSGQGVTYESLQMAGLEGYRSDGCVHVVLNNQIGFTTEPDCSRYTDYCTDIAKTFSIPVLRVNAMDVDACARISRLACEWSVKYGKDVFIDLIGYRKYGHNESDEPRYTQPEMYKNIDSIVSSASRYRSIYEKNSPEHVQQVEKYCNEIITDLDKQPVEPEKRQVLQETITPYEYRQQLTKYLKLFTKDLRSVSTSLPIDTISTLSNTVFSYPLAFKINPKLSRLYHKRKQVVTNRENLDWGTAEMLAYASLVHEGYGLRMSGQDTQRGTFSHRHAVLHSMSGEDSICPLQEVNRSLNVSIINSLLSEYAVLGFEYGYALEEQNQLVIWEAQFGDFSNGAQVIIDQFISSGEHKWSEHSSLVLFLPHGYEGQGPEHSSARLERFLQLSTEANMVTCNLTKPAQIYHLLRRHTRSLHKKPMVVMTPKSLLRHPKCTSNVDELANGTFHELIVHSKKNVKKNALIFCCSGKVLYDICDIFEEEINKRATLVSIEQLYPFPLDFLIDLIKTYESVEAIVWVQEEPKNMGAWMFVKEFLETMKLGIPMKFIGRKRSASVATGYSARHKLEVLNIQKNIRKLLKLEKLDEISRIEV
jgi:2-oxoglutarate dehydrogenase E1 component